VFDPSPDIHSLRYALQFERCLELESARLPEAPAGWLFSAVPVHPSRWFHDPWPERYTTLADHHTTSRWPEFEPGTPICWALTAEGGVDELLTHSLAPVADAIGEGERHGWLHRPSVDHGGRKAVRLTLDHSDPGRACRRIAAGAMALARIQRRLSPDLAWLAGAAADALPEAVGLLRDWIDDEDGHLDWADLRQSWADSCLPEGLELEVDASGLSITELAEFTADLRPTWTMLIAVGTQVDAMLTADDLGFRAGDGRSLDRSTHSLVNTLTTLNRL